MKIHHSEPYAPLRAKAYPAQGDQLDAIFKLAQALKEQGIQLPTETLRWLDACQQVKETYPKNRS